MADLKAGGGSRTKGRVNLHVVVREEKVCRNAFKDKELPRSSEIHSPKGEGRR